LAGAFGCFQGAKKAVKEGLILEHFGGAAEKRVAILRCEFH
jgi:hypothetical protein